MQLLGTRRVPRTGHLAVVLMAVVFGLVGVHATPAGADGPDGPDTCLWDYVWRDAGPGDHVCVTPQRRDRAAEDNELADSRRSPNGGEWGPDTCLEGFVWREAFPGDRVCVTPERFDQVQAENEAGPRRRALDRFRDVDEMSVDRPTGVVRSQVTLELGPNGAYSFRVWAFAGTLARQDAAVACVVPLRNGDAMAFSWDGEVGGVLRDSTSEYHAHGTSAEVADNWTKLPRDQDAECQLGVSLDVRNLLRRLLIPGQITGRILRIVVL